MNQYENFSFDKTTLSSLWKLIQSGKKYPAHHSKTLWFKLNSKFKYIKSKLWMYLNIHTNMRVPTKEKNDKMQFSIVYLTR